MNEIACDQCSHHYASADAAEFSDLRHFRLILQRNLKDLKRHLEPFRAGWNAQPCLDPERILAGIAKKRQIFRPSWT
jgi:hypothetical protein